MHPSARRLALSFLVGAAAVLPAQAQTLLELYQSARAFDATYLAARAQAESEPYRAEQAEALLRPSAAMTGSAVRVETNPAFGTNYGSNSLALGLTGRYPLFNRANIATVAQARTALQASRSVLEAAEQDLIVRVAQAYFDVLAAQDALATSASRAKSGSTAACERSASVPGFAIAGEGMTAWVALSKTATAAAP